LDHLSASDEARERLSEPGTSISEAIYVRDPDGNGIELYWDKPKEQWPRSPDGGLAIFTHRLDLDELLAQSQLPS